MVTFTYTERQIADEIAALLAKLTNRWISLADVRVSLARWSRDDQDNALRKMERAYEAKLARQSSRVPLTPEDRAAAVVVGGEAKHLIWVFPE